jgi:hypothetical protein
MMKKNDSQIPHLLQDSVNRNIEASITATQNDVIPVRSPERSIGGEEDSPPSHLMMVSEDSLNPQGTLDGIIDKNGQALTEGTTTADKSPIFSGTADPGCRIEISVYPPLSIYAQHYTVTVGYDGQWSIQPTIFNSNFGYYEVHVSVEDGNGNNGHYLSTMTVAYFDPEQVQLNLNSIVDQVNNGFDDYTGPLANHATTDDARPELQGTASPGMEINIYDNGILIGTTTSGSNWSFRPSEPLDDGPHHFYVTALWQGQLYGQSDTLTINIDATPPDGELLSVVDMEGHAIAAGTVSTEASPVLSGIADPGSAVHIHVYGPGGKALYWADASINPAGNWTWQAPAFSEIGTYSFHIAISDPAGNVTLSAPHYTYDYFDARQLSITLDSVSDNVHQSANDFSGELLNGAETNDNMPVLQGRANAGFILNIYDNGQLLGSTMAGPNGDWNFRPLLPLPDGEHSLSAKEVLPSGSESAPTTAFIINVMATPPEGDLRSVSDSQGHVINTGGLTAEDHSLLSGDATPGSEIHIHVWGPQGHELYMGTVMADEQGNWQYQTQPFSHFGKYAFTIAIIDIAGNVSRPETTHSVQYYDPSLFHVALTGVYDTVSSQGVGYTGLLKEGDATDDTSPKLQGTANGGMQVNVYDNGHWIGAVYTGSDGYWSLSHYAPFSEGDHAITVTEVSPYGETPPTEAFHFRVDTTPPEGSITQVTTTDGELITPNAITTDASPIVSGHADPGSEVHVHVYRNGQELYWENVTADAQGNWHYQPQDFTAFGSYNFTIALIGPSGVVDWPESNYSIQYYDPDLFTLTLDSVTDNVSNGIAQYDYTGVLAEEAVTNDSAPVLQGTANAASVVKIYDNGNLIASVQATEEGHWSLSGYPPLSEGEHHLTVTEITPVGESQPTAAFNFTVDALPPQGEVTNLVDQHGDAIAQGATTTDPHPVISGYATPGSEVHIHVIHDGQHLYWEGVTAGSDGQWSWQPEALIKDGEYQLTVSVIGQGGNIYRSDENWTFELHTTDVLSGKDAGTSSILNSSLTLADVLADTTHNLATQQSDDLLSQHTVSEAHQHLASIPALMPDNALLPVEEVHHTL